MTDVGTFSAIELARGYRDKTLSPFEVTRACLDRIQKLNPTYNAFCLVDEEAALEQARYAEQRFQSGAPQGPLDGVPIAIKDLILTKDWPTLRGSKTIDRNQPWSDDAPSVERLREQGAVFVGKTTTSEFGWKAVTDSPLTGVTRNPHNLNMTPGGSSGGSAVAVATNMVPLALGTDGAGSIRIPAGFCGVVGFKPSFGVVPLWPASPFGPLAHLGPITRAVPDAKVLLQAISGRHWRDPASVRDVPLEPTQHQLSGIRVAYSPRFAGGESEAEINRLVSQAVGQLGELGAEVTEVDELIDSTVELVRRLWAVGAAQLVSGIAADRLGELDPGLVEVTKLGTSLSAVEQLTLVKEGAELAIQLAAIQQDFDVIVTPTLPIVAFETERIVPIGWHSSEWMTWAPYSHPFNLTQQPAISIPCGLSRGLPVGIQIVGRRFEDAEVLLVAGALEKVLPAMPFIG